MKALWFIGLALLTGCASAADLRPSRPTGAIKDGFEQTSEGLAFTILGRSVEDVWQATLRGAKVVTRTTAHLRIVDQEPGQFVKIEGMNAFDSEVVSYTGLFVVPQGEAIQVQASKLYKVRWVLIPYGPSEADYLRAVQVELGRP